MKYLLSRSTTTQKRRNVRSKTATMAKKTAPARRLVSGPENEAGVVQTGASPNGDGFSMVDALITAVDNKDRYTRQHSEGVVTYGLMIAREIGLDEQAQSRLATAALLHDVGKIGIPDCILSKPSGLTPQEFEAVKRHPEVGAVIVSAVDGLQDIAGAIRHHHERWDGLGYPLGLCGDETPLSARIIAVADSYDAMTSDRPYRTAMPSDTAVSILLGGSGSQWDPACVAAFARAIDRNRYSAACGERCASSHVHSSGVA